MKFFGNEFLTSVAMTSLMATSQPAAATTSHCVTRSAEPDETEGFSAARPSKIDLEIGGVYHDRQEFEVPGVAATLKLRRQPRAVVRDFANCCIDDWNISVPSVEATPERMANEVVRSFLGYFRQAQQGELTAEGRKVWRKLLSDIDSDMYAEVSAPAVQALGVIKKLRPEYAVVQWSDDPSEDDRVDGVFRERISYLREGDIFSAAVKFVGGKLVSLDNVLPCNV